MSLYQALHAFEPERIAEMNLDQTVRVFGWDVVVDEDERCKWNMHPEGCLKAVRLDWENEEVGLDSEVAENEDGWDGDGDAVVVKSEDA